METLNLFYQEPNPDRWVKYDRFPRKWIRRLVRGKPSIRGQFMVFHNLIKGLEKIGCPYRLNDFKYAKKNPAEICCILGKDQVLTERKWLNPIIFGPAFGINPLSHPNILVNYNIKKLLVPGAWVKDFFSPYGAENVVAWPVGIDTEVWKPQPQYEKHIDFLLYNKVHWDHETMDKTLVEPIKKCLARHGLSYTEIVYGHYKHQDLIKKISLCRNAIFIGEHETQGIAYQQILSSGLPILAWDRGGYWQDPSWYPHKIKYQPVSSVPYWDKRCGVKFKSFEEFETALHKFKSEVTQGSLDPRQYILENLTLEKCSLEFYNIVQQVKSTLNG